MTWRLLVPWLALSACAPPADGLTPADVRAIADQSVADALAAQPRYATADDLATCATDADYAALSARVDALDARLSTLEASVDVDRAGADATSAEVDALRVDVDALTGDVSDAAHVVSADTPPMMNTASSTSVAVWPSSAGSGAALLQA